MKAILVIAFVGVLLFKLYMPSYTAREAVHKPFALTRDQSGVLKIAYGYKLRQGLDELNKLRSAASRFTKKEIIEELDVLKGFRVMVKQAPDTLDSLAYAMLKTMRRELVARQLIEYPILRKHYIKDLSNKLSIANASASCSGGGNREATFTGGTFAFMTNVQYLHEHEREALRRLHFTRVNYEWDGKAAHGTNYVMVTDEDSTLAAD